MCLHTEAHSHCMIDVVICANYAASHCVLYKTVYIIKIMNLHSRAAHETCFVLNYNFIFVLDLHYNALTNKQTRKRIITHT